MWLQEELSTALEDFPPITPFEIITYLVLTHSFYTNKQMEAYKSLAAYKFFEAGFVHDCGAKKIGHHIVVVGKVKHSQRMNEDPLRVWIICQVDGAVNSAHCTCMAGLSEVCSHIAAVLYAVEYMNTTWSKTSSTDVKAKWVNPACKSVPIMKLSDINLKAQKSRSDVVSPDDPACTIRALEGQALRAFLLKIKDDGDSAVLLRVVEPFATELSQETSCTPSIQNPYKYDVYKEEYELLAYADLCNLARQIDESISDEERQNVQLSTIGQNQCSEWYKQRAGRITGSSFKRVCHTSIVKPSLSTVKAICYPLEIHFKSKAVAWGLQHEARALNAYEEHQMKNHINFKMSKVGLCIEKENSFLAASPDSLVACDCCRSGCVEVKCPYLLKDSSFKEYLIKKIVF
ncbi:unnamed protein product [Callosobruchus maculatus]|uniref:SWIM-type domain-containing protein n=1 Tax=Callosobruchus maculatus TaxID=64391 RepID=A0A653DL43_CALMS|nr:unnamed protein product [Callosobruchus maculatus]